MSGGLPVPVTRVRRHLLGLFAVVLIAGTAGLGSGLSDTLSVTLLGQVDANWRGSYDILVRPAGARSSLEQTGGLVEPNFLGFTGRGGISLDQVARIRALPGVDLAAPVSFVGYLTYVASNPVISLGVGPTAPTLYEITMTTTSNDGTGPRLLQRQTGRLLLGPGPACGGCVSDLGQGIGQNISLSVGLPPLAVPVLAVDPPSERSLLGASGAFLSVFDHLGDRSSLRADTLPLSLIPRGFDLAWSTIFSVNQPTFPDPTAKQRPVVPLVVSSRAYADLRVQLDVVQLGHPLASAPSPKAPLREQLDQAQAGAGSGRTEMGSSVVNLSSALRPFQATSIIVPWPGTEVSGDSPMVGRWSSSLVTRLAGRPSYSPRDRAGDSSVTLGIASVGAVAPDDSPVTSSDTVTTPSGATIQTGALPAYRVFRDYELAVGPVRTVEGSPADSPFYYAPIGTFDPSGLDLSTNPLSYVPLGAYHPPDTTLIAGPDGMALPPAQVLPTFSQAGIVTPPPLAITDIEAAALLRGDQPIDAIRVRVAGLAGFDAAAREKVERTAAQIAQMGLDVDVVAGSSPQGVDIYVPSYFMDQQPPADLGWVRQGWTTLGAAQRVALGFGGVNTALTWLAIVSASVFAVGLQVIDVARRRRAVATLLAIGWSRVMVLRWIMAEALVGAVLIAGLAVVGWLLGGRSTSALAVGVALALIWLGASLAGAALVVRSASPVQIQSGETAVGWRPDRLLPVSGPLGFAARSLLALPVRTAAEACGLGVAAAAVALSAGELLGAAAVVGPTLLAGAVAAELAPAQIALLAATTLSALVFAMAALLSRHDETRRERQILRSAGWPDRQIGSTARLTRLLSAVLAAGLAAILVALLASPLGLALGPTILITLLACAAIPLLVGPVTRLRKDH